MFTEKLMRLKEKNRDPICPVHNVLMVKYSEIEKLALNEQLENKQITSEEFDNKETELRENEKPEEINVFGRSARAYIRYCAEDDCEEKYVNAWEVLDSMNKS